MTTTALGHTTTVPVSDPVSVPGAPAGAVRFRDLDSGDAAAVRTVFAGLSPRSRELRFLTPKPRLTDRDVRALTAVDPVDHVAVLAVSADDRPVGIARFVRDLDAPDSAEVGIAVVDAWQDRGVGAALLEALVRRARAVGVRRFTALVSHENQAVRRLLRRSGREVARVHADRWAAEYVVSLEGEPA